MMETIATVSCKMTPMEMTNLVQGETNSQGTKVQLKKPRKLRKKKLRKIVR
jgi:hypothetical protein